MKIDCIEGWKHTATLGNITIEDSRVIILDGICDSCDLCGISACRFYDISPEATRRFLLAQAREHTLEGLLEKMQRH
jgi:hypothetical protein